MAFALQGAVSGTPPAADQTKTYVTTLNNMIPTTGTPDTSSAGVFRTQPFPALAAQQIVVPGFSFDDDKLSLEPTIQLDQMSRYLNHLHELRRINEGDDVADSPG